MALTINQGGALLLAKLRRVVPVGLVSWKRNSDTF